MKCPFKPIKIHKNRMGYECYSADSTIAKIETDFGDCDKSKCMAYKSDGTCRMMNIREIKNEEF